MTLFNLNYFLNGPFSKYSPLGIRVQDMHFWGDAYIQFITPYPTSSPCEGVCSSQLWSLGTSQELTGSSDSSPSRLSPSLFPDTNASTWAQLLAGWHSKQWAGWLSPGWLSEGRGSHSLTSLQKWVHGRECLCQKNNSSLMCPHPNPWNL